MPVPEQCQRCYKYYRRTIESACSFCQNIGFTEQLLCDITREAQQGRKEFECAAFRPNLMIVRPQPAEQEDASAKQKPTHNIMQSEKIKWVLAYAKQQLAMHPDEVMYDLKYHLCVSTRYRNQIFQLESDDLDDVADVVRESSGFFDGTAYFLSLGADHLHIYFESTPDEAVEDVVKHIMAHTEAGLREILGKHSPAEGKMFHQEYFVETVGP